MAEPADSQLPIVPADPSPIERFALMCEVAAILFACALAVAAGQFAYRHAGFGPPFLIVVGMPSAAALILIVLGTVFPAIVAIGRIGFPLNLTLPSAFTALLVAVALTVATSPTSSERIAEPLRPALYWVHAEFLVPSFLGQVLVLTVLAGRRNVGRRDGRTVD